MPVSRRVFSVAMLGAFLMGGATGRGHKYNQHGEGPVGTARRHPKPSVRRRPHMRPPDPCCFGTHAAAAPFESSLGRLVVLSLALGSKQGPYLGGGRES
jgi:hypothetical protein